MSVQIDGTVKKKSGGGGLGSLIGKVLGGAAGFVIGGPAGAMTGAQLGGGLGGAAGGMIDPAKEKQLGVAVGDTGPSQNPMKQETSAIDRLNKITDIGSTIYGGVNTLNNLSTPKLKMGNSTAIDRKLQGFSNNRSYV